MLENILYRALEYINMSNQNCSPNIYLYSSHLSHTEKLKTDIKKRKQYVKGQIRKRSTRDTAWPICFMFLFKSAWIAELLFAITSVFLDV